MFDQFLRTGKERREAGGFIGFEGVRKHLKEGPPRRRIGLVVEGAPARHGAKVVETSEKKQIGTFIIISSPHPFQVTN